MREAALNVQPYYQSTYRIQRAELFPAVSAKVQGQRQHIPASFSPFISGRGIIYNQYTATLGLTAYELDFFGRVRSLEAAAL